MDNYRTVASVKLYVVTIIDGLLLSFSWMLALDIGTKLISLCIAIMLAIYARKKYKQDMRNKKLEEQRLRIELENQTQIHYQLLAKNRTIES